MNPTTLALLIRGIGLLLLIAGGVYALFSGFRIIQSRNASQTRATFKILGATFTAAGIGAVIMMTAGVWAYLGVRIAPNLTMDSSGTTKVYAFVTEKGNATVPELTVTTGTLSTASSASSSDELRKLFTESINTSRAAKGDSTLKGLKAQLDAKAASIVKKPDGNWEISAPLVTDPKTAPMESAAAEITFAPEIQAGRTIFVPIKARIT